MKKLCLSILAMMLLIPSVMYAEEDDVKIGNLWYNLIDKAKVAEVTDCDRNAVNVVVPSTVNYNGKTYKVERIREKAFSPNQKHIDNGGGKKIKSLQLPEGIVEICESAISTSELESVNIPNSVTIIGERAFNSCRELSSPIVLTNVERIEYSSFYGCESLTSITLSDKVTYIGEWAFYDCKKLKSIALPNKVTTIERFAFAGCISLKSVLIPTSVKKIGLEAFEGCCGIENLKVDSKNMFYDSRDNCNAIVETRLNRIVVGCQNTIIPNGIWEIGDYSFNGCKHLKSIIIPPSVYYIGWWAFYGCEGLSSVTFQGDMTGKVGFQKCNQLKSIVFPFGVTDVQLDNCNSLEYITLPSTLEKISVSNCQNLIEIEIPDRTTNISIDKCKKIKSVKLPYNSIHGYIGLVGTFNECDNLEVAYIPSSVKEIGNSYQNCPALLDVYCFSIIPPKIASYDKTFDGSDIKYTTLHVPAQSVEQYSNATKWNEFGKIVGFEPQIISVNEALSILQEIESQCKSEDTLIDNLIENSNKSVMGYGYLSSSTTYPYKYDLKDFLSIVQSCINEINKSQTTDYYQIENIKHLWDNTYSVMGQKYRNILEECLNNLVYVNFKCNAGGKIVFGHKYYDGNEIQNNSENFSFYNPTLIRKNIFALFDVFALPYDGYHVQSFKVGGVDVLGISNIFEYQYSYETKKGYSFPFSYQNVEVIFASGESSIQSVRVDGKSNSVYSINGIKVRENTTSLDGLPKGIYIVDGKKVVVK